MKNVVSKVLMMFVVSFMLFTCSYAEIEKNIEYSGYFDYSQSKVSKIGTYSSSNISLALSDFINGDTENLTTIMNDLISSNVISDWYVGTKINDNKNFLIIVPYGIDTELFYCETDGEYYLCFSNLAINDNFYILSGTSMYVHYSNNTTKCIYPTGSNFIYFSKSVKQLSSVNGKYIWVGESYYYKASSTPDTPSFEGITDSQKALIINSITSSEDFNLLPSNYLEQFFIVYDTWSDSYKVYFYPKQYSLKGRVFDEGSVENVNYKSYKIVAFEGSNFLWDLWQSISPFDYYVFKGSFNSEGAFDSYFYDRKNSHELNQYYFSSSDEPIVYTSKDIGFVIYNVEDNKYEDDTENSISKPILRDENNNEIIITIPENNSSLSETPWQRLVNIITFIPSKIADAIANKMGFDKVMFILSPLFETIIELIGLLIVCLAFIGRAITFVYTLPTIEASSALFIIDVDTTTKGLAFTGNTWGTHFLSGLDKLKALSWGGASLWSFFEAFVVALVTVIAIKFVRKHYHI